MKTLIYLAGLVAVGLAVAWFGFGFVDVIKNNYEDQDMTQPMAH